MSPSPLEREEKMQIIYKRDWQRHAVILKPDTFYWRLRFWVNQYLAMFCAFLIWPVVRFNHELLRLDEGETIDGMFLTERMGLIAKDNKLFRFTHPKWLIKNRQKLNKAFLYFRDLAKKL